MLEKIVQIKSIGRFRDYNANGDVALRKLTLVHADNGRGKTTLCSVLRSLQGGKTEFITERKTLGSTTTASAHLRINGVDYRFTNNSWTGTHPDILIFDPVFVNENVFSGDFVEHEHKKNLYRAIVGAEGVRLASEIEELDKQIRELNHDIRTKRDAVSRLVLPGGTVEDYLQWQPVDGIAAQIAAKSEELITRQRATERSGEILTKGLFEFVQLPSLPADFTAVLAKQLADIVVDAEAKVRRQIAQHQMGSQGEPWLSQGIGYVRDERCPFCGQGVQGSELLAAYNSHFSSAYRELKEEVAQLAQRINNSTGEASLGPAQRAIAGNAALAEFWRQFFPVELPEISFQEIQMRYRVLREEYLAVAKRKEDSPTETVTPGAGFTKAVEEVEALRAIIATYNEAVAAANVFVQQQKADVGSANEITALKSDLAQLQARMLRFEPEAAGTCQAYESALAAKARLELQKESTREQLDRHCEELLHTYERSINEFLDQFNAGFRITNSRHLYTGGTPSSHYQIEINGTALELGDSRTPAGTPCFKTSLSSGDRSALALAFFLAVLKQDQNIGQRIVVFDDPFTSLDRFRRSCTQQLIQRLSDSAQQVIVLSHDPHFLKLIYDDCPDRDANVKTLQMTKAKDTTVIGEWDILSEAQSSYMKDYSTLLRFYSERKGDRRAVARTIRPFLEGMLRNHFPGHFQPNAWLGEFIDKIRAADATSGLQHAKAELAELEAINGFSKKYHHLQNANADTEPIDDDELHGYVKRTLRLVGGD